MGKVRMIWTGYCLTDAGGNCNYRNAEPFYYHNAFMCADINDIWIIESSGKHWVAKKVSGDVARYIY